METRLRTMLDRGSRRFGTGLSFVTFGVGGTLLSVTLFPFLRLIFAEPDDRAAAHQRCDAPRDGPVHLVHAQPRPAHLRTARPASGLPARAAHRRQSSDPDRCGLHGVADARSRVRREACAVAQSRAALAGDLGRVHPEYGRRTTRSGLCACPDRGPLPAGISRRHAHGARADPSPSSGERRRSRSPRVPTSCRSPSCATCRFSPKVHTGTGFRRGAPTLRSPSASRSRRIATPWAERPIRSRRVT